MPMLKSLKPELESLANPTGGTLYAVAKNFLGAGLELHTLLSARGDAPKASREQAGVIRGRLIGALAHLRADVKKEVAKNTALPRDLEQKIFGYFDTLSDMEKPSKKLAPAGSPPAPADPAKTP